MLLHNKPQQDGNVVVVLVNMTDHATASLLPHMITPLYADYGGRLRLLDQLHVIPLSILVSDLHRVLQSDLKLGIDCGP